MSNRLLTTRRRLIRAAGAGLIGGIAAPYIAKASFMNFGGSIKSAWATSNSLRSSLVFIGDSITWGHGIDPNQTWAYLVQQRINTKYSFSPIKWAFSSAADICSRYIQIDDTTATPFNGGQPPGGGTLVGLISGSNAAGGQFKDNTSNANGGNVAGYTGFTQPGLQLSGSSNSLVFQVTFPSMNLANCYCYVGVVDTGGGAGDNVNLYCDWNGGGALNGGTPISTPGSLVGPFTGPPDLSAHTMSVQGNSGFAIVSAILPSPLFPTNHLIVQICARNSYSLSDYSSPSGDTIAKLIMNNVIATNDGGVHDSTPIYVITAGIVSMVDPGAGSSGDRRLTPSQYSSQLSTLAQALVNGRGTGNGGRVILTVPLYPSSAWLGNTAFNSGLQGILNTYTFNDYRQAIISLANSLGLEYLDLSNIPLVGIGGYQSDGLHPNATGATLVASQLIGRLEL